MRGSPRAASKGIMPPRRPRVMQSFRAPRATTNPYIVMLDRALAEEHEIEHLRFSWPGVLLRRVDILHLHWPETLLGGDRPWKRWGKRMLFRLMLVKLRLTDATIVRTVHNLELPKDVDSATKKILTLVEERADYRILLNENTVPAWTSADTVIPHGHYRDWFAGVGRVDAEQRTIGFVGLIRRYKGVEALIEVFASTADTHPELRLRISGNPTSTELAEEVRALTIGDPRVSLDLQFLNENDFATAMMRLSGVVLPYRFMHNSGATLAALSLARPVLVPRNDVNIALAEEVGEGWVHMYDEALTADDLIGFSLVAATRPDGEPRLDRRDWSRAGADHVRAYREATRAHHSRKGAR